MAVPPGVRRSVANSTHVNAQNNAQSLPVERGRRALALALGVLGAGTNVGLSVWFLAGTDATTKAAREPAWDPAVAVVFVWVVGAFSLAAVLAAAWILWAQKLPGLFLVVVGAAMTVCAAGLGLLGIGSYEGLWPALFWAPGAMLIMVAGGLALASVGAERGDNQVDQGERP